MITAKEAKELYYSRYNVNEILDQISENIQYNSKSGLRSLRYGFSAFTYAEPIKNNQLKETVIYELEEAGYSVRKTPVDSIIYIEW